MIFSRFALLLCIGVLLPACSETRASIGARLAELEAEREAFEGRVAQVEDEALREEIDKMAGMLFWMREAEIESERPPEETAYASDPLRILDDYDDLDAMTRQYADGIVATSEAEYLPEHTEVELPFGYPFEHALTWNTATLDDGTRLPVTHDSDVIRPYREPAMPSGGTGGGGGQPAADGPGVVHQRSFTQLRTYLRDGGNDVPPVRRLDGVLKLGIPGRIHRVGFTADEVGEVREAGGFSVKFESLDGHRAMVSVKPAAQAGEDAAASLAERIGDMVVLTARDASGQTLDDSGSSSGPPGGLEEMQRVLDDIVTEVSGGRAIDTEALEAKVEAREQEFLQAFGGASFRGKTFRGKVAELDVLLIDPAGGQTREVPLSLTPMHFDVPRNTHELVPFPVAATVYDHGLAALDGGVPDEVDPAGLDAAITVVRDDRDDMDDLPALVRFHYPDVVSNRMMSAFERYDEALDVTFLDADGTPIAMPEDEDAREELYRFTVARIEYHREKFPVPPARVTGRLEVDLRPAIRRHWMDADSLPDGAQLTGNAYFEAPAYDNGRPQVYAQDRTGRYLRKLSEVRYIYDDSSPRVAHYFYGTPTRILLLYGGPTKRAIYPFDVDLTR